ncbi:RDD family protein [Subtercola sp. PAMC28395]|uniref:RDD family protein n=1 Tax=Subtercola sp. PAMC28395 TaxID=2846775 RepID=UPI001C0E583E|nr:RDD family protein [Subtercola sp. PAMC28395]QWT25054.1 RDD family protein [Subtercola sp. PAMC28395]
MAEPLLAPLGATHSLEHNDALLVTGEAVALDVRPTSFILRAAGTMIDVLFSVGLFIGAVFLISFWQASTGADDAITQAAIVTSLVFCIVVVPTVVETLMKGRSLGRLAVGARIVRDDGGAASFRHAFIRALTGVLEIYFTLGGLAVIVALLNPRSKRLGDLLAGTYSQHERVPKVVSQAAPMPPQLYGWAQVADVAKLPDRLARRIAQFLAEASHMTPDARQRHAAALLFEAAPFVSPVPPVPPELLLLGIAALRRDRETAALHLESARLARLSPLLSGLPHGYPRR